ncbi:hypothetical protein [Caballeronia sp. SL2Y3]|uniref:hypothetical protein n=1 Tax=Caballeronia sp. SL2Y3 TaxID=2878151 RepID=UPI001FD1DABE|nr:hypothetical protein [Caballeronia sp. SL2Y3]
MPTGFDDASDQAAARNRAKVIRDSARAGSGAWTFLIGTNDTLITRKQKLL